MLFLGGEMVAEAVTVAAIKVKGCLTDGSTPAAEEAQEAEVAHEAQEEEEAEEEVIMGVETAEAEAEVQRQDRLCLGERQVHRRARKEVIHHRRPRAILQRSILDTAADGE